MPQTPPPEASNDLLPGCAPTENVSMILLTAQSTREATSTVRVFPHQDNTTYRRRTRTCFERADATTKQPWDIAVSGHHVQSIGSIPRAPAVQNTASRTTQTSPKAGLSAAHVLSENYRSRPSVPSYHLPSHHDLPRVIRSTHTR